MCGKELPPYQRYEDSDWCEECVETELYLQQLEGLPFEMPQVFSA